MNERAPDWQSEDGTIKLHCADCLDVLPTLEKGSVDAVVTDPPYQMGIARVPIHGGQHRFTDSRSIGLKWPYQTDWIQLASKIDPAHVVCCCSYKEIGEVHCYLSEYWKVQSVFVWRKSNAPRMTRPIPRLDCEFVIWARSKNSTCGLMREFRSQVIDIPMPYAGIGGGERIRQCKNGSAVHPCQKPVALIEPFCRRLQIESVCDPFMGTGTTSIACINTNRHFLGIEREEKYFEIAVKRIEKALAERKYEEVLFGAQEQQEKPQKLFD